MIVYGIAQDIDDGAVDEICTIEALPAYVENLKKSFRPPEGARDIVWIDSIAKDGSVTVTWKANTGKLLNMNGPLDGPREERVHGKTWDFIPFEVFEG